MVGEDTVHRSPLLPNRMGQGDFFVCDIFDAAPKGDMASMGHPIFSLSTKPDHRVRRYEGNNGSIFVEVKPSADGLATIHDRDVLIYCISQLMAAINEGRTVSRVLRFQAIELLKATNRGTDGRGYEQLKAAMTRLQGTQIETNIATGGVEQIDIFSLVDRVRILREGRRGRMLEVEVTLSDWVFNAIESREVLTIHRNYFLLRKPLERRLYEIGRKHLGRKDSWSIGLNLLQEKCGSFSTLKEFRRLVGKIAADDETHAHIPDFSIRLDDETDQVIFTSREAWWEGSASSTYGSILLKTETYETAKRYAEGHSVYGIEADWRRMLAETRELPETPDGSFINYVKWYAKKHGSARS